MVSDEADRRLRIIARTMIKNGIRWITREYGYAHGERTHSATTSSTGHGSTNGIPGDIRLVGNEEILLTVAIKSVVEDILMEYEPRAMESDTHSGDICFTISVNTNTGDASYELSESYEVIVSGEDGVYDEGHINITECDEEYEEYA